MSEVIVEKVEETTFCEKHPEVETRLRCNQCERLMCTACAMQTPVGYRCKECVRGHEDKFYTSTDQDGIIVGGICLALAFFGAILITIIPFLLLDILISVPLGGAIAQVALRATGRRRGRYSAWIGAGAAVIGGFCGILLFGYGSPFDILYIMLVSFGVHGGFQLRI